jgi:glucan biosynthesis protein C
VPFVAGVYLLMPVFYYPVYRVTATDPSWLAYWSRWQALPFWPCGPLWFLSFLLALNIAAAALYRLAPRAGERLGTLVATADVHPLRFFLVLVGLAVLVYVPMAAIYEPWEWLTFGPFALQPSFALQYVVYFFAGLAIGAHGFERGLLAPDDMLARRWRWWLAGALAAFLLWIVPTAIVVQGSLATGLRIVAVATADLGFALSSATSSLALAALFLRIAARPRPLLGSLSEHAYGIYFIHYLFVLWTQYLLLSVALPAAAKAAIVLTVTLALSWGAAVAVSRIPFGARLIGGRRRTLPPVPARELAGAG